MERASTHRYFDRCGQSNKELESLDSIKRASWRFCDRGRVIPLQNIEFEDVDDDGCRGIEKGVTAVPQV